MSESSDRPVYAVLMAGGMGTRFWPASRRARPKQFLSVEGSRSLLTTTRARIGELVPPERTLVVASAQHERLVREELPELPFENLLLEPVGRNTLACVAWAAVEIQRRDPNSVQLVLPADHVITPPDAFVASVRTAIRAAAAAEVLVTFGIRPSAPSTAYGYVEVDETLGDDGLRAVRRFVEKPDRKRAEEFLRSGRFLWNSGMFVWRTDAVLAALAQHAPEVHRPIADPRRTPGQVYASLPSVSVDVGLMEKARAVRCLPVDYAWSDVGSWPALADVVPADAQGNHTAGGVELLAVDSEGCIVHGDPGEIVALVGVRDLVVVHSRGATLVCTKERAQDVRRVVERLERDDASWL